MGIQTLFGKVGVSIVGDKGTIAGHAHKEMFTHRNTEGQVSKVLLEEFIRSNLPTLVDEVLSTSGLKFENLQGIAVTIAPGESYVLSQGLEFAIKDLGIKHQIPIYPINNHEAHIFSPRRLTQTPKQPPHLPFFSVKFSFKSTDYRIQQNHTICADQRGWPS